VSDALQMIRPGPISVAFFVAIVLTLVALLVWGVGQAGRALGEPMARTRRWVGWTARGITLWLALTGFASYSGVLRSVQRPPPLFLFVFGSLLVSVIAALSPLGARLGRGLPIAALVGYQAFRLPLELVLHAWVEQGVLPKQMTYTGHNFDIVSGITALLTAAWLVRHPESRALVWGWNLLGTALLATVLAIAVLSSPLPIRMYMNDPPVLLPLYFPYGWIIPFCVGGALFGHVIVFRWLVWRGRTQATLRA
jgi:hypothetical protein